MTVPPEVWRKVFERDGGFCRYCGDDLLSTFSRYWCATVDHLRARSVGGTHDLDNLVLCCPACNGMLSRAGILETFEARSDFVRERRVTETPGYMNWLRVLRSAAPAERPSISEAGRRSSDAELELDQRIKVTNTPT